MKPLTYFLFWLPSVLFGYLSPSQKAPLYDHLYEVNKQWEVIQYETQLDLSKKVAFKTDIDRIASHLELVLQHLYNSSSQWQGERLTARNKLLATLSEYQQAKRFPINHYHTHRQPYFIDNYGTPCAVGHLMIISGYQEFAYRVARENNYTYVLEMEYEEVPIWATKHGFTIQELALIQPGYGPRYIWNTVAGGANSNVTCLYTDESHDRLIIAGVFDTLGTSSINQIGYYQNNIFHPLGNGVKGEIASIAMVGNDIYLGGFFADSSNIAKWDGSKWVLSTIANGKVHVLKTYRDTLIAGGDFEGTGLGGEPLKYIAQLEGTTWRRLGTAYGPVYSIEEHQGELVIGGDFADLQNFYVAKRFGVRRWADWSPIASSLNRLNYSVKSLASDGTYLYATGHCKDNGETRHCLSRFGNSGWEALLRNDWNSYEGVGFQQVLIHQNEVYVVGDFWHFVSLGTSGTTVGKLVFDRGPSGIEPELEFMGVFDSTVSSVAAYRGSIYVGGKFVNFNHLAKTDLATSISSPLPKGIDIYPNPARDITRGAIDEGKRISKVLVYDLNGRVMNSPSTISSNHFSLSLSGISPGVYFVEVWTNKGFYGKDKLLIIR